MPLNLTGDVIKSIKLLKTKTIYIFQSGKKYELGRETASTTNFAVGDYVEFKQFKKLKETDELNNYLHIALNIAKKGLIAESNLETKLIQKGATTKIVKDVIRMLKQNDILNDEGFILDYMEYANELLYGENKIKEKLYLKGIKSDRLTKLKFNQSNELRKAKEVIKQLLKANERYSYELKKQRIYSTLLSKGFTSDIALKALSSIPKDNDDKLTIKELNAYIEAFLKQNKDKYDNNRDIFNALTKKLIAKGYPYNKIKKVWEDKLNEFND